MFYAEQYTFTLSHTLKVRFHYQIYNPTNKKQNKSNKIILIQIWMSNIIVQLGKCLITLFQNMLYKGIWEGNEHFLGIQKPSSSNNLTHY